MRLPGRRHGPPPARVARDLDPPLAELGLELRPHRINRRRLHRQLGAVGPRGERVAGPAEDCFGCVEELLEHVATLELIDVRSRDVVVVMAGRRSVLPSVVRRLTGATCWLQSSLGGPGVDGDGAAAAGDAVRLPDGFADKVIVEESFDGDMRSADPDVVAELGRVLAPGGAAAAFVSLSADDVAELKDGVLAPAGAAGLEMTVHQLVNVTDLHPRAEMHVGLVLRRPAAAHPAVAHPPAAAPGFVRGTRAGRLDRLLPPAAVVLSAATVAVMTFADVRTPLRPAVALLFLLACPGLALVHALRLSDRLVELTLAAAVSIAVNTLVASTLLLAGVSSSKTVLAVLLSLSLAAVVLDVAVGARAAGAGAGGLS